MSAFTDHERGYLRERRLGRHSVERTKKYPDVKQTGRAAIVVDDVVSTSPWKVRGVEIRGRAEGMAEPRPLIRIDSERIVSWGVESERLGERHARTVT